MAYDAILADSPYAFWTLDHPPGYAGIIPDASPNGRSSKSAPSMKYAAGLRPARNVADIDGVAVNALLRTVAGSDASWTATGVCAGNNWTWEGWVRPRGTITIHAQSSSGTNGTGGTNRWLCYPDNSTTTNFAGSGISIGTNGVCVVCHSPSFVPVPLAKAVTIPSDVWTHIAISAAPAFKLHVNGALVHTGVQSGRLAYAPAYVGSANVYGATAPVAYLTEAAWFSGALTDAKILAHYQAGMESHWKKASSPMVMG